MVFISFFGVCCHFRSEDDSIDARKLLAIAQEQLRKRNYEGFAKLIESFQQADKAK